MALVYPVVLEALKSAEPISESLQQNKNKIYAVISENNVLVSEKSALALGYKYYDKYRKINEIFDKIDVLSYNCPEGNLITKKGIFKIKNLGSLLIKEFQKGMLAEYSRHTIKPPSEK